MIKQTDTDLKVTKKEVPTESKQAGGEEITVIAAQTSDSGNYLLDLV